MFGTYDGSVPETAQPAERSGEVEILPGQFGGVSGQGIYLSSKSDSSMGTELLRGVHTKLDVPNSYVLEEAS